VLDKLELILGLGQFEAAILFSFASIPPGMYELVYISLWGKLFGSMNIISYLHLIVA